jgi:nucleoid DNA-binding protein
MAWKPPIKELKRPELVDQKEFFRKLAAQCGYIDDEMAAKWYLGLVRLVSKELRTNQYVRLPHLGDMAMITQNSRPAWHGTLHLRQGPKRVLRFYPKEKLRRYMAKAVT